VILCGFAVIVGTLTTRAIYQNFNRQVAAAADRLSNRLTYTVVTFNGREAKLRPAGPNLNEYASANTAAIRVVKPDGGLLQPAKDSMSRGAPFLGRPVIGANDYNGWRVEGRRISIYDPFDSKIEVAVQYAERISGVRSTANRVKLFLGLGVLAGAALALLAGLATARRAMEPISELAATAREIERTRDTSVQIPRPEADDEVAELAETLDSMLHALDDARTETEAALTRQREFVADASHELRTPLTSVLANLELLEETTKGEQRETAASALRSSRRMRRLVADLLLLARADAGRRMPHRVVDLSEVVTEAAAELEPVAGGHEISVSAQPGVQVDGARDELHRLVLNLMENALRHTDPGTAVEAAVERRNGEVVLSVEDDGPGIPLELHDKVFERFFRGEGDRAGSSGLGLSIVKAVADSHSGRVTLEPPLDGRGARFVVFFPSRH
jgi:signal transduction histidine kinase